MMKIVSFFRMTEKCFSIDKDSRKLLIAFITLAESISSSLIGASTNSFIFNAGTAPTWSDVYMASGDFNDGMSLQSTVIIHIQIVC